MKLISSMLLLTIIVLVGCSTMERKDDEIYVKPLTPATFSMDYDGKLANLPPETWAEFYDAGTYLYRQGKYDKAMEYFLSAANLASGEAKRTCLIAAAVSSLAASDSAQFVSIRQQIRSLTEEDPFKQPTPTDKALGAIDKIERY